MKHRKTQHPYLIYSLLIHIVLLLCVWWFSPKDTSLPPSGPGFIGDIFLMPRPAVVKPPEPVEDIPAPEPQNPAKEEVEKPPALPKPTVDLNNAWLTVENEKEYILTDQKLRQENSDSHKKPEGTVTNGTSAGPHTKISQRPNSRTTTKKLNRDLLALSTTLETTHTSIQADTSSIVLGADDSLDAASPAVSTPKINYGSRRGDVFRVTGMGNAWGGGGYSGEGKIDGTYIKMMRDIAQELTAATVRKKVDVVIVLDETASMVDNIRGIRAYFEFVFDAFKREGHDATFGLVTFTDKTKTHGRTDDFGTFKNWLFKIEVDHGGDISEAGLDALMTAVQKIKFRRDAQRFFILASDAAFHDADFDGKSSYSLDEVIATLQKEQIRVEVIGLDYLPIKQIAMATGGTWRAIPGKGYLEYVPPLTLTVKMLSKLGTLSVDGGTVGDKITVYVNNPPRPKQVTLTWKVLNPLGERCYGPFIEKREIPDDTSNEIELTPLLDSTAFQTIPGIYTVIYRLENDQGHKSILRRTLTLFPSNPDALACGM